LQDALDLHPPFLLREMAPISKEEFQYMLGCLPNLVGAPGRRSVLEAFCIGFMVSDDKPWDVAVVSEN
jgi:hypothetical protein